MYACQNIYSRTPEAATAPTAQRGGGGGRSRRTRGSSSRQGAGGGGRVRGTGGGRGSGPCGCWCGCRRRGCSRNRSSGAGGSTSSSSSRPAAGRRAAARGGGACWADSGGRVGAAQGGQRLGGAFFAYVCVYTYTHVFITVHTFRLTSIPKISRAFECKTHEEATKRAWKDTNIPSLPTPLPKQNSKNNRWSTSCKASCAP